MVVIITTIKGDEDSSYERQVIIADGENEFDQNDLTFGSEFKTKYNALVKSKNLVPCDISEKCDNNK